MCCVYGLERATSAGSQTVLTHSATACLNILFSQKGQCDLLVWDQFGLGLFGLIVAPHVVLSKIHHSSLLSHRLEGCWAPRLPVSESSAHSAISSSGCLQIASALGAEVTELLASALSAEAHGVGLLEKRLFSDVEAALLLSFASVPPSGME